MGQTWKTENRSNPVPAYKDYEYNMLGSLGDESIFVYFNKGIDRLDGYFYFLKDHKPIHITGSLTIGKLVLEEFGVTDGQRFELESDIETYNSYAGFWTANDSSDKLVTQIHQMSQEQAWPRFWMQDVLPTFKSIFQKKAYPDTLDFNLAYRFINMLHDDYTKAAYGDVTTEKTSSSDWPEGDYIVPTGYFVQPEYLILTIDCHLTASAESWFKNRGITGEHIFTFDHRGDFISYFQISGSYQPYENDFIEMKESTGLKSGAEHAYEFSIDESVKSKDGTIKGPYKSSFFIGDEGTIHQIAD